MEFILRNGGNDDSLCDHMQLMVMYLRASWAHLHAGHAVLLLVTLLACRGDGSQVAASAWPSNDRASSSTPVTVLKAPKLQKADSPQKIWSQKWAHD